MISFAISACTSVKIKDKEFCINAGIDGGRCNWALHDEPVNYLPGPEWDAKLFGSISMSPEHFGQLKIEIEQLCEVSKRCSYEFKKKMGDLWNWYEKNKPSHPDDFPLDD